MKILLSPSKTLDFDHPLSPLYDQVDPSLISVPPFLERSKVLVEALKNYQVDQLQTLMSISVPLATLNRDRYRDWKIPFEKNDPALRPAIFAFKGDVYEGIDVKNYHLTELEALNQRLIILSGLYGVLLPLALIRPYRLEMGTKLETPEANDLYRFWGDRLARWIESQAEEVDLINLASNEYFKVVKNHLKKRVITPVFKDQVKGQYKVVSFWAKRARGLMTSFIVKNQLKKVEELRFFDQEGYRYDPSPDHSPVFLRDH